MEKVDLPSGVEPAALTATSFLLMFRKGNEQDPTGALIFAHCTQRTSVWTQGRPLLHNASLSGSKFGLFFGFSPRFGRVLNDSHVGERCDSGFHWSKLLRSIQSRWFFSYSCGCVV